MQARQERSRIPGQRCLGGSAPQLVTLEVMGDCPAKCRTRAEKSQEIPASKGILRQTDETGCEEIQDQRPNKQKQYIHRVGGEGLTGEEPHTSCVSREQKNLEWDAVGDWALKPHPGGQAKCDDCFQDSLLSYFFSCQKCKFMLSIFLGLEKSVPWCKAQTYP